VFLISSEYLNGKFVPCEPRICNCIQS